MIPSRQRIWKSSCAQALCAQLGTADPVEATRRSARALIARVGSSRPPFSPFAMAGALSITKVKFKPIGFDACLIPTNEGFEVLIRSDHPRSRQNFSMAHELGHLLFMQATGVAKEARRERNIGSNPVDQEEEYLCDIAASELLLPSPFFEDSVRQAGPSLTEVMRLAKLYEASLQATIRRFVGSGVWKCFFLLWRLDSREQHRSLELESIFANGRLDVPKDEVALLDESEVLRTLENGTIVRRTEWLRLGDFKAKYYMESIRIGGRARRRVLSMVVTEPGAGLWHRPRTSSNAQLNLFARR
jgi:hypothetical protein